MKKNKYIQGFKALNIPIEPVPSNYSPEEFGRKLLSMSHCGYGVSYAASTNYVETSQKLSDNKVKKQ